MYSGGGNKLKADAQCYAFTFCRTGSEFVRSVGLNVFKRFFLARNKGISIERLRLGKIFTIHFIDSLDS